MSTEPDVLGFVERLGGTVFSLATLEVPQMEETTVEYYDPFEGKIGFALASRTPGLIHVAGMTGFEPKDMSVPEDLADQMRLAYGNIAGILEHYGLTLRDTVEQTVFVVGDVPASGKIFTAISRETFGSAPPPCTMVGVTALIDPRYKVEIKLTAKEQATS